MNECEMRIWMKTKCDVFPFFVNDKLSVQKVFDDAEMRCIMHSSELGIVSDNCAEQRRICQPLFPHAKSKMAGNLLFIFLGNANLRSRFRLIHLR